MKGILYSNNDAFFFGLGLRWRADPGAHAVLAPWLVFQEALRNQVFNKGALSWLWDVLAATRDGPLVCACKALARAG
eukprot:13028031-Heterocapsa_arctica.AAC.1